MASAAHGQAQPRAPIRRESACERVDSKRTRSAVSVRIRSRSLIKIEAIDIANAWARKGTWSDEIEKKSESDWMCVMKKGTKSVNADVNADGRKMRGPAAHGLGLNAGSMDGARTWECVGTAGVTGELAPEGRACICSLTLVKHASHTRTDWLKPRCSRGMRCDEQREQYRRPAHTTHDKQRESGISRANDSAGEIPAAVLACGGARRAFLFTHRILCSDACARAR